MIQTADGALADISLGQVNYRVYPPFAGKVNICKTVVARNTLFMLDWKAESGFLEAFESGLVHEIVRLILTKRWNSDAEQELARTCKEKYVFTPVWGIVDFSTGTSFIRSASPK